jgi:hypothetical protein
MTRTDILALTPDDLAAWTNRGTVKRSQRDLESGEFKFDFTESPDGSWTAQWSDGVTCTFPANKVAREGACTCPATEMCRHLVRSLLAYQKLKADDHGPKPSSESWNPGDITDDQLTASLSKTALAQARQRFAEGLLIELVRSSKPTARIHQLSHTIRFQVPGDVRYTQCDCAEPAPCSHSAIVVWAFRLLAPQLTAGLVSTQAQKFTAPTDLLDEMNNALLELAELGFAGAPPAWRDQLRRLENRCLQTGLAWPAQILADLVLQYERYTSHDALFTPQRAVELAGELLIRSDAIRSDTGSVPQLLIRGSSADRQTDIGSARYIGLGCRVQQNRKSVELVTCLQDADSGSLAIVSREFAAPTEAAETTKEYWQLAQTSVVKGCPMASLAAGQLLTQGSKRTAEGRLIIGRARASVNPQNFSWDQLRAPVLAEDFAELRARLGLLPPASLRARHLADDFHVCPIAAVQNVRFDEAAQQLEALLVDHRGENAKLVHPYSSPARQGFERALFQLHQQDQLCYVSGQIRTTVRGLVIFPVGLVFQNASGRYLVQPWIDRESTPGTSTSIPHNQEAAAPLTTSYPGQIQEALSELLLLGLRRSDARTAEAWKELHRQGEATGYHRLANILQHLVEQLDQKTRSTQWNPIPASHTVLSLLITTRFAQDTT